MTTPPSSTRTPDHAKLPSIPERPPRYAIVIDPDRTVFLTDPWRPNATHQIPAPMWPKDLIGFDAFEKHSFPPESSTLTDPSPIIVTGLGAAGRGEPHNQIASHIAGKPLHGTALIYALTSGGSIGLSPAEMACTACRGLTVYGPMSSTEIRIARTIPHTWSTVKAPGPYTIR